MADWIAVSWEGRLGRVDAVNGEETDLNSAQDGLKKAWREVGSFVGITSRMSENRSVRGKMMIREAAGRYESSDALVAARLRSMPRMLEW